MTIRLAQIAPKLGRLDDNLALHRRLIADAWAAGCDLVVFPELSLTGYLLRDHTPQVALEAAALPGLLAGLEPAADAPPIDVVLGFVELSASRRCHASAAYLTCEPGRPPRLTHVHRKVYLPTYGMFDERRYFTPGRDFRAFDSRCLGRCGLLICEDWWYPTSPWLLAIDGPNHDGATCLIGLANSPARGVQNTDSEITANLEVWRQINALYAQLFGVVVISVQRAGVEDSYIFTGGSEILGPTGEPLARAPLFDEALTTAELDVDALVRWHRGAQPSELPTHVDLIRRELERITREAGR